MDSNKRKRRYPGGDVILHEATVARRLRIRRDLTPILLCRTDNDGGGMSACIGCESHAMQENCPYYEKAPYESRCTDLAFGEYCRNTNAQDDSRGQYY